MPKISPEVREQIRQAVRNPVVWWKGAGLPEETLRPWEGGIQFLAEGLKGFMHGFVTIRNRIFTGMAEGKVPPNLKTIADITNITWDALNDPLIGLHMDRKRYGADIHRWVMRFNATLSPLLILVQSFDFGLTPVQRVIQWMILGIAADFISTANAVSETKIWAGITPHTEQRGQLQMFRSLGGTVGALFTGIPVIFMGLKDVLGVTDYQIMIAGVVIFAPLTIFSRWLPTFAKQRVDFTIKVNAGG